MFHCFKLNFFPKNYFPYLIRYILINLPGLLRGDECLLLWWSVAKNCFYVNKPRQGNLSWTVWRRVKYCLRVFGGVHLGMTSPEAIFPGSLRPTMHQGLVWSISVQVGGHLGAIVLCCRSHKSFNLGSFSVSPTLTDESSFVCLPFD